MIKNFNGIQLETIGTVVQKYDDENYEVEFFVENRDTINVFTISSDFLGFIIKQLIRYTY